MPQRYNFIQANTMTYYPKIIDSNILYKLA